MAQAVDQILIGTLQGTRHHHTGREWALHQFAGLLIQRPELGDSRIDPDSPSSSQHVPLGVPNFALGAVVQATHTIGELDIGSGARLRRGLPSAVATIRGEIVKSGLQTAKNPYRRG